MADDHEIVTPPPPTVDRSDEPSSSPGKLALMMGVPPSAVAAAEEAVTAGVALLRSGAPAWALPAAYIAAPLLLLKGDSPEEQAPAEIPSTREQVWHPPTADSGNASPTQGPPSKEKYCAELAQKILTTRDLEQAFYIRRYLTECEGRPLPPGVNI